MSELRRRANGKPKSEEIDADESSHNHEHRGTSSVSGSMIMLLIGFAAITVALGLANYFQLTSLRAQQSKLFLELGNTLSTVDDGGDEDIASQANLPTVWVQGKKLESGFLRHVFEVFERLGYRAVNGSEESWDVLWAHDYPFGQQDLLKGDLQPHQRVNHFPGSGFITNKVSLATSGLRHIPVAFHLPKEKEAFLKHTKEFPDKLWVKKSNDHRGIRIEKLETIDLDTEGTFVQEFVQKPFLVDGRKFDIGLYVTMTSVNPLRVYMLDEILLRFCAHDYYPFNATDLDSYVVGDDYTPIWEIPSMKKYFVDAQMNFRQSLDAYLRAIGKDPVEMWRKIEDSIRSVYIAKHPMMAKMAGMYGPSGSRHFFEMVRFDFVVDEDLNIFLMEANMSPNLSSLHFAPNQLLYEHVIFNVLSLAGLALPGHIHRWPDRSDEFWNMMVSDKDLSVFEDICASDDCHLSCKHPKCKACLYCLDPYTKLALKDAYVEHLTKCNHKRLIPSVNATSETAVGIHNELQHLWFTGMCLKNVAYCS